MSKPELYLENLEINQMPGFPPVRAFAIDDLSPGINIIHGPQESGKTTVAEAIALLVHGAHDPTGSAILRTLLRTTDEFYDVRIDAGQRTFLKDGEPDPGPSLSSPDAADRYKLWLHELLQAEDPNRDFAQLILQESAGGYDVRKACEDLGFRRTHSTSAIGERQNFSAKSKELRRAIGEVIDPGETERLLRDRKQEREEAQGAQRTANALKRARTYRAHQNGLEKAERRLEELPEALENVTGNEPEKLAELRQELDESRQAVREAENKIKTARERLDEVSLPDEDLPTDLVRTLRRRIQKLGGMEDRVENLEREVQVARANLETTRDALGEVTDPDALKDVDTNLVQRAEQLAEKAATLREKRATLDAVETWLTGEQPSLDADDLKEGLRVLRRWLQVPAPLAPTSRTSRIVALVASALTGLIGLGGLTIAVAGFANGRVTVASGVLFIAGLVLLFLSWRSGDRNRQPNARETYEQDFERTSLKPPSAWERDAVQSHVAWLEDELGRLKLAEEREGWRDKLSPDREAIEKEEAELTEEAERTSGDLGVRLKLGESSFLWFVRNLSAWQKARTDVASAEEGLKEAQRQRDSLLDEIADKLAPYGYDKPESAESALAQVEILADKFQTFRSAKKDVKEAEPEQKRAKREVAAKEKGIAALFNKFDLEPGDDAGLQRLCGLYEEYEDALGEKSRFKPVRDQALKELRKEPGYDERMEDLTETEIQTELEGLQTKLNRLEELRDEVPKLEERIRSAKQEYKVEAAIEARDRAVAALRDKMEEETAQVVGWVIAEHVHEKTKDQDRPVVFHRARELLATITRGRHQLQMSNSDPPEFRALDTRHNEVKALDQLSSGTRVQLLLAVRLAFVEQQEQGPMLPILLDETLANTDDIRAHAIIDSVLRIAQEGRQVFYLTAQDDEVRKWAAALEERGESGPPYRFIDLAKTRALSEKPAAPTVDLGRKPFEEIPEPKGKDHRAYGRALSVPHFNPGAEIGDAHIWYVVDDPELIYRLLGLGIERWGQVRTMWEETENLQAVVADDQWNKIQACAKALSAFGLASSIGRGKLVDRAILEEAPGVTDRKLDELAEVAERFQGDGGELLAALERGEVPRFYQSQYEKLEEFLHQEGFVDEREKLSPEDIKERVLASVAGQIKTGVLTRNEVLALLENATKGV